MKFKADFLTIKIPLGLIKEEKSRYLFLYSFNIWPLRHPSLLRITNYYHQILFQVINRYLLLAIFLYKWMFYCQRLAFAFSFTFKTSQFFFVLRWAVRLPLDMWGIPLLSILVRSYLRALARLIFTRSGHLGGLVCTGGAGITAGALEPLYGICG